MLEKLKEKYFPDGFTFRNPFASGPLDDLSCGIFGFRPKWLQYFRSMKVFMTCYIILGVFHGMYSTYISTVIPSLEKRFGFTSREVGTFRAMSDVSRIFASLVVAHYGGAGHRPRWIGFGAILLGLGMFLMAATEGIFPVTARSAVTQMVASAKDSNEKFCHANITKSTYSPHCEIAQERSLYPLMVLGFAEFVMGLGATSIVILALPFIDDNVATRNTPLYFAFSFVGRLFGPLFGFGLGAICTNIFFDFSHPNFKTNDPRWVAAWYLGLLVCAAGILISGFVLMLFPSVVRDTNTCPKDAMEFDAKRRASVMRKCVTYKDFPRNLRRIFTNVPFMTKLISQLLEALVISGYLNFLQKFIREQYQVSQSTASLATGIPGVFVAFVGIFTGSFIIKKFKMEPRHVSLMTAGAAIVGSAAYFIVIAFGCDKVPIVGIDDVANPYNLSSNPELCENRMGCNCPDGNFNPICDVVNQRSYISACVAGCMSARRVNGTKVYSDCSCLVSDKTLPDDLPLDDNRTLSVEVQLVPGLCQVTCHNFIPYIVVMCVAKLVLGLPISGVVMMQFRLVDYDLKSLANGVSSVMMSLFGFLPAPIIAGAIIDTACSYWQQSPCGEKGSCLLYNAQDFRWKLHVTVAVFKLITCAMDLVITWQVWKWSWDREESKKPSTPRPSLPLPVTRMESTASTLAVTFKSDTEKNEEDKERADQVPEMSPRPTRARLFSQRRMSAIPDHLTSYTNPSNLVEEDEEIEKIPTMFMQARRGSLLD
ncbi:hypothetical protein RvY_15584 [Ramazzottius varieornatus]|uniref:Solute carrier organic anion transporter family member n=1 Tax=Ramazzottius varieornatus TaxID=947166 RepID=A0A1D1VWL6_RAMVA|nr:hypothetical protein RvY_15584 [Ramazzottius varieornatus]